MSIIQQKKAEGQRREKTLALLGKKKRTTKI
jgi:hypothetical protein